MDHRIKLTVAPNSDIRVVASNPLSGLDWQLEGLLNGLNPGVLGALNGITAATLDPLSGLDWQPKGLLNGLNPGVLGALDSITAATLDPLSGLDWQPEGLLNGLNPGVLGALDGITAATLDPLSGLDWQPSRAIPDVVHVDPERLQTAEVSRRRERVPAVRHHHDLLGSFDNQITFTGLIRCTRALFADGHYSVAVEKAFVYVENLVKQRSGLSKKYGSKLMKTAFSVQNPLISLNAGVTDSEINEQLGYMEVFAGAMTGIRNPRAHAHDWIDEPKEALELLVFANLLVRKILMATSSRNPR